MKATGIILIVVGTLLGLGVLSDFILMWVMDLFNWGDTKRDLPFACLAIVIIAVGGCLIRKSRRPSREK